MKKMINAPADYVNEMLEGIYMTHSKQVRPVSDDPRCFVSTIKKDNQVAIATGGGSGHLPLFLGYVGEGMLDGCSVGDVFQSPNPEQMLAVTKEIDAGAGVLYIYGNYNGDIFNFNMAAEMAEFEYNIRVESIIAGDDVASAKPTGNGEKNKRRGVAGIFFVYKCAGAAAAENMPLDEVKRVAQYACDNVRTMGVALSSCTIPRIGKPGFKINEDEMEIGMGIHGEAGMHVDKIKKADEIVDELMTSILADLPFVKGNEVAILINGLGSTPLDELYIIMRRAGKILAEEGISLFASYVGEYATSMEMAGASISLFKLNNESKRLLSSPANTPFFKQFQL